MNQPDKARRRGGRAAGSNTLAAYLELACTEVLSYQYPTVIYHRAYCIGDDGMYSNQPFINRRVTSRLLPEQSHISITIPISAQKERWQGRCHGVIADNSLGHVDFEIINIFLTLL